MKYNTIYELEQVKAVVMQNDNLLEGLIPEVKNPEGGTPQIDRFCKPDPDALRVITQGKNFYHHIDIWGNGNTITYNLGAPTTFDCFLIYGVGNSQLAIAEFELYASYNKESLYSEANKIVYFSNDNTENNSATSFAFEFDDIEAQYIGIKVLKACARDELFRPVLLMLTNSENSNDDTASTNYSLSVNTQVIVNPKFYGTGATIIPMNIMPEAQEVGFSESHFALESAALKRLKLNVVRLWFQVDWITNNYEDYKNGVYTFHSQKFEAVCKYIKVLQGAGSDVYLNFGWKQDSSITDWFSFREDELPWPVRKGFQNVWRCAPKELDLFAKACVATIKELVENRGFNNVKYLTFYNEPRHDHDFATPVFGAQKDNTDELLRLNAKYWRKMADLTAAELEKAGMRQQIAMWGPEYSISAGDYGHIPYFSWLEEESDSPLEVMTYHRYDLLSCEVKSEIDNARKYTDKPLLLGETATLAPGSLCWDNNETQRFIELANAGYSGMLYWLCIWPSCFTGPSRMMGISDKMPKDNGNRLIRVFANNRGKSAADFIQPVGYDYPLYAMFDHYVPCYSKVVQTGEDYNGLRYAAFITPSGDYTVIVEAMNSKQGGHLTIRFDKTINKTFYLHKVCKKNHYDIKYEDKINGVIPPCCGSFEVNETLDFDFDGQYGVYCFTTMESVPQVNIDIEKSVISAGESVKLTATIMDASGELEWSVVAGDGTVDNDGVAVMPITAIKDDIFAVKAQIKGTNTYAVAVVICE